MAWRSNIKIWRRRQAGDQLDQGVDGKSLRSSATRNATLLRLEEGSTAEERREGESATTKQNRMESAFATLRREMCRRPEVEEGDKRTVFGCGRQAAASKAIGVGPRPLGANLTHKQM
jgi:hypothetical protein